MATNKVIGKAFKVEINGQFLPTRSFSGGKPGTEQPPSASTGAAPGTPPKPARRPLAKRMATPQSLKAVRRRRPATPPRTSRTHSGHNECTVGHNEISELTIEAYVTQPQTTLAQIAHKVANLHQNQRMTIVITEMAKDKSVVKTYTYGNCLLTSLDFPAFSANGGELLYERATFKPEFLSVS